MTDESLPTTLDFDFTEEQLDNIETLPNGDYRGEVVSVAAKLRQAGHVGLDQMIRIPPEEYPADFDGDADYPDGITIPYRFIKWDPTNRPAVRKVRKHCNALGVEFHSGLDYNDFVGKWARWTVVTETDQDGEPRNGIVACHSEEE